FPVDRPGTQVAGATSTWRGVKSGTGSASQLGRTSTSLTGRPHQSFAMVPFQLVLLASIGPGFGTVSLQDAARPPDAPRPLEAHDEADAHNYLVTRLRLLKRGAAVEEIKTEIVNQIDFGKVSPRSIELLRRMMGLCDRAITNQVKVSQQLAELNARA